MVMVTVMVMVPVMAMVMVMAMAMVMVMVMVMVPVMVMVMVMMVMVMAVVMVMPMVMVMVMVLGKARMAYKTCVDLDKRLPLHKHRAFDEVPVILDHLHPHRVPVLWPYPSLSPSPTLGLSLIFPTFETNHSTRMNESETAAKNPQTSQGFHLQNHHHYHRHIPISIPIPGTIPIPIPTTVHRPILRTRLFKIRARDIDFIITNISGIAIAITIAIAIGLLCGLCMLKH